MTTLIYPRQGSGRNRAVWGMGGETPHRGGVWGIHQGGPGPWSSGTMVGTKGGPSLDEDVVDLLPGSRDLLIDPSSLGGGIGTWHLKAKKAS